MEFRKVAVAAMVLVLSATAALAAYQLSEQARGEAAQTTIERTDSLAVEPGIVQVLVSDDDHDPTAYGQNGTETVEYQGTVWVPGGNYTYYPDSGELEFLRDESGEANITYQYDVPEDQVADDQLQTATRGLGQALQVGVGLSLVGLLLFVGWFAARKVGVGNDRMRSNR